MKSICLYFQVHQPFRLRTYRFFDIGQQHDYFDNYSNRYMIRQLAEKCYLPANQLLLDMIKQYGNDFRVAFSLSGMALEQFELYVPEVLESFKKLAKTGNVDFLTETYNHGLAALKDKQEFSRQVKLHESKMKELFGIKPTAFRNTELIYNDEIGSMIFEQGYNTILTEGPKHILGWKSPNLLYCSASNPKVKLLMKNFQLSDDIVFRFSIHEWNEWPLTAGKYVKWLNNLGDKTEVVNLFLDYETFGYMQPQSSGIFDFFKALPEEVFQNSDFTFKTPAQLSAFLQPASTLHIPFPISWADEERDITAWLGNEMQNEAFDKLFDLLPYINTCKDEQILTDWNRLQTSDHFYYMSTKWFSDGVVKIRPNPYNSPYDAFINYMNVLVDFEIRVKKLCEKRETVQSKEVNSPVQRKKKTANSSPGKGSSNKKNAKSSPETSKKTAPKPKSNT